jgi:hypothetical protein
LTHRSHPQGKSLESIVPAVFQFAEVMMGERFNFSIGVCDDLFAQAYLVAVCPVALVRQI